MPTYTTTIECKVPDFTPDLTQRLDVSLTGTEACIEKIGEFLSEADEAFQNGAPYPEKFDFLDDMKELESLPFKAVENFKLVVDSMPIEHAGHAISLVAAVNSAFPEVGMEGKCYNVKPALGKRITYNLKADCGAETLKVVQTYEDAMPGDTRVPDPTVLGEDGKAVAAIPGPELVGRLAAQVKLVNESMAGEPDYILPSDKFNPMAMLWLLQNDLISLSMQWDSGRHNVTWLRFTENTEAKAAGFISQSDEIGRSPMALLEALAEDDYGFPSEWVHPKLEENHNFLMGNVDIMTILRLCEIGMWKIQETSPSAYEVSIDHRLARGVPDSHTLIARLLWKMREHSEIEGAFTVSFSPQHLSDADNYISDFDGAAFGAQEIPSAAQLTIDSEPTPDPNGGRKRPFDGGKPKYDRDLVNDKDLFVRNLRKELKDFPRIVKMDGGVQECENANERMKLLPGDLVTLVSTWNAKGVFVSGIVVEIAAYSREKKPLGVLKWKHEVWDLEPDDFDFREMSCLLPYITATVSSVDLDAKAADVRLRLEFDRKGKTDDEIVAEVLEDMQQVYSKRAKLSRGPFVASDLLTQYGWDGEVSAPSPIPDTPNPAPEGSDNPRGERLQLCENVIVVAGEGKKMFPMLRKMKENTLKHIKMIDDGWYYDEEELKSAKTFEELYDAIWRDIREHFRNVFNLQPTASYVEGSGSLAQLGRGDRNLWIICYKTWNKPNDDDLKVFFEGVKGAKFGLVRLFKREAEKSVHVNQGIFESAKGIVDLLAHEELHEPKDLAQLRPGLQSVGFDSKELEKLALRVALGEVFGDYEDFDGERLRFGVADHPLFDLASQPEVEREALAEAPTPEPLSRQELEELDPGEEPEQYVKDGKFDPLAAAWLLHNGFLLFEDGDIAWNGKRHRIEGLRVNAKKEEDIPCFMQNAQQNIDLLIEFLNYLEDDRKFVVPRSMVSPGLYEAIREGDLTGMTFFALLACGRAMKIEGSRGEDMLGYERDFFKVTVDERIAMGLPAVQDLAALLAHDMRMYADSPTCPQTVTVVPTRIAWADKYLGEVPKRVAGAELDGVYCMQCEADIRPDVTLPGDPEDPNTISVDFTLDLSELINGMDAEEPEALGQEAPSDENETAASEINEEGEGDPERAGVIGMLKLLVLGSELSGAATFPQEMLDELDRAEAGDESVDLEDLARRMNELVPEVQVADLSNVTYDEGAVAKGRRFEVAAPDGWTVISDYVEKGLLEQSRPFVMVQGEAAASDNLEMRDRVIYSAMGGDVEVDENKAEVGTHVVGWALRFYSTYDRSDDSFASLKPVVVWDEEVDAANTKCLVVQQQVRGESANALEFNIHPYANDHHDFLRVVLAYEEGVTDIEQARAFAKGLAASVRLDAPVVPKCEKDLESAVAGRVSPEIFKNMVEGLVRPYAGLKQMIFTAGQYKYLLNTESPDENELTLAGARAIAELCGKAVPYYVRLLDAYDRQAAAGASIGELGEIVDAIEGFDNLAFPTPDIFDAGDARLVKKAGIFNPTDELVVARARFAEIKKGIAAELFAEKERKAAEARKAEEAAKTAKLEAKEKNLSTRSAQIYRIIQEWGGSVDLSTMCRGMGMSWSAVESMYADVCCLGDLVKEKVEEHPVEGKDSRCKRFYTWRQVDAEGKPKFDAAAYAKRLDREIEYVEAKETRAELAKTREAFAKKLDACGIFDFSGKREMKEAIADVDRALAELSGRSSQYGSIGQLKERAAKAKALIAK